MVTTVIAVTGKAAQTSGEWHEVRADECSPRVVETANKERENGEAT